MIWTFLAWFALSFVVTVTIRTIIAEGHRRANERDHGTPYDAPPPYEPMRWPAPTDKRIRRF